MKITIDFKDPKKEIPDGKNFWYLIVTDLGIVASVTYSEKFQLFNASSVDDLEIAKKTAIYPRYWAEIPPELMRQEDDDEQNE